MNILQIGCNNCDDHVTQFVNDCNDQIEHLILIDIHDSFTKKAKDTYRNVKKLTTIVSAITPESNQNELILYHLKNLTTNTIQMIGGHTSFNYDHMIAHDHSPEKIVKVVHPARTITSVLDEYNITNLNRLYIDTEGLDVDILMSIDYNKYNIDHITFEHAHCGGSKKGNRNNPNEALVKFLDYMNTHGYDNRTSNTDSLNTDLIKRK